MYLINGKRYHQKYSRCRQASKWYLEAMTPREIKAKRKREEMKDKKKYNSTLSAFSNALPTRKWLQSVNNIVRAPLGGYEMGQIWVTSAVACPN
jgi:hypothetical protein